MSSDLISLKFLNLNPFFPIKYHNYIKDYDNYSFKKNKCTMQWRRGACLLLGTVNTRVIKIER